MSAPDTVNPWTRIRQLMDAVPEERRRLISLTAWVPSLQCGCVFGTIYPGLDRSARGPIRVNFDAWAGPPLDEAQARAWPEVAAFRLWMRECGLSAYDVRDLQTYNDRVQTLNPQQRWAKVYRYVVRREGGAGA